MHALCIYIYTYVYTYTCISPLPAPLSFSFCMHNHIHHVFLNKIPAPFCIYKHMHTYTMHAKKKRHYIHRYINHWNFVTYIFKYMNTHAYTMDVSHAHKKACLYINTHDIILTYAECFPYMNMYFPYLNMCFQCLLFPASPRRSLPTHAYTYICTCVQRMWYKHIFT